MLLTFFLSTLALLPSTDRQTPRAFDLAADTARQIVVDRQPGQYLGHVSTVLLGDGSTILAVYPLGHGRGAVTLKRSGDGGRTWSGRLPVPGTWATSQETPTIWRTVDAAGKERLILWSGLYPARIASSSDNGASWSELAPAGDWGGIVVMGDVMATATAGRWLAWFHDDGRYLAAPGAKTTGIFTLLQCESRDGGASWSAPQSIWRGTDMHLCEPGALRSQDGGELWLLLRENRRRAPSQLLRSRDEGASWSPPEALNAALCGDRHRVRRTRDGRLAVVFRAMPLAGDGVYLAQKGDFVLWVGTDADLLHGNPGQYRVRLLDNKDPWDCGYAGLELLPDDTLVATTYGHWQADEPPYIVSVRCSLAELDRMAAPAPTPAKDAGKDAGKPANNDAAAVATAATDLAADLATLESYLPNGKAPTVPAVAAATEHLMAAIPKLRAGEAIADRLSVLLTARRAELVPTSRQRIRDVDPLARVLVRFDDECTREAPVATLSPHPAAAAFPGDAPADTVPTTATASVDLSIPGRHSLGLYARPGAIVDVRFGDGDRVPKGVRLRIGAHSDDIARRPQWPRMPRVSRTFAVDRGTLQIGNAYGGLVYVEVQEPQQGTLEVQFGNVVGAPLFELGRTAPEQWRKELRDAPGPWAELATDKVVLTVPSERVRKLDDPTELLLFWNSVLDAAADLAARPHARARPERYVADVEISAGAMHSGYPIMTHLDAAADMTDVARMRQGPWGLFHELGHNHQQKDWTFAGTGEVTCNLFALHICDVQCQKPWDQVWNGNLARAQQRLNECRQRGAKPWGADGEGKADLALRLLMYSEIQRGFGWEAFMHTFALYRDLPAAERPKTEDDKRDQWLVRLSSAVDRDLGPFFAAWGLPVSDAARKAAAAGDRLAWMPEDW